MTLPADPRGAQFVSLLWREQFSRGMEQQAAAVLDDAFRDLVRLIVTEYADLTPARRDRVALLFARVTQLLGERYGTVERQLLADLAAYGGLEADVARAQLAAFVARSPYADGVDLVVGAGPTRAQVLAIAELPVSGATLGESLAAQWTAMTQAAKAQIRLGLLYGENPEKIARRLYAARATTAPALQRLDTPDAATAGGVARRARRDVRTLVRTATTAVHAEAAHQTYAAAGADVVDRWRYSAVLDARTSEICRGLSGTVWRMDDPKAPRPPSHPNCRSALVPLLSTAMSRTLGLPEDGVQPRHQFSDYSSWLKTRPVSEQDRILGKTKAHLWREGRITLRDLVAQDGRTLTLTQLAERMGVPLRDLRAPTIAA